MGTPKRRKTHTGRVDMGNAEAAEEMDDLDTEGPVAIMWDIENCPIPAGVPPMDVSGNIRNSLMVHGGVKGAITTFSAYGDYSRLSKEIRQGCQKTGINLIDVPSGNKDAADKAILIDMFLFALDNRPPALILLISGDVDFAPALHKLRQRGYTIAVALPRVKVHSALSNAGKFVWDWHNMASNKGLGTISRFNADIMAENFPKSSLNGGECQGHQPEPTNANGEKIPRSDLMPSLKKLKGEKHLFSTGGLHQEWQGTTTWNAHLHKYQRKMQCIEYVFRSFDNPIQGTMSATIFRSFDNPMPSLKKREGENHRFSPRGLHQEWQGTTTWNAHSHKYQRKMQCIEYVFRSFDNPIQGTVSATVFRSFANPIQGTMSAT